MQVHKRARVMTTTKLVDVLPCLTGLTTDMDNETEHAIAKQYFDPNVYPNRFKYASIVQLGGHAPYLVIDTLKHEGAFSSQACRRALVDLVDNARDAGPYRGNCTMATLDTLERYAKHAFSLEKDMTIGCGSVDFCSRHPSPETYSDSLTGSQS